MFGRKPQQQSSDLTTPAAVKRSQKVYDRITSGKAKNATAELDSAHGRGSKRGRPHHSPHTARPRCWSTGAAVEP